MTSKLFVLNANFFKMKQLRSQLSNELVDYTSVTRLGLSFGSQQLYFYVFMYPVITLFVCPKMYDLFCLV